MRGSPMALDRGDTRRLIEAMRSAPRFGRILVLWLVGAVSSSGQPPVAPPPTQPTIYGPAPSPPRQGWGGTTVVTSRRAVPRTLGPVSAWRERADSASQVIATLGSVRSLVQTNIVAEGTGAFLLANPSFSDESAELAPPIIPGANTKLFFESRQGYATTSQFARAQISTNGGASWITAWSQTGSGGAGDGGYRLVTVPLGTYAGISLRVRFFYEFTSGSAYTSASTSPPTGWFIDDIQIGESFSKRLYTETGEPTADEVLILEYINRARSDATAEAERLAATTDPDVISAMTFFGTDRALMRTQFAALARTTQPLAMNSRLLAAARLHSQDMLANVFQGHYSSSNPPPPNMASDSLGTRLSRQGYSYSTAGENVFAYAKNPWHAHAGFNIDWGSGTGGMQNPPGHRLSIHDGSFREVGIGVINGTNRTGASSVGPMIVTQDFAATSGGGQPLITGVAYNDADGDNFYDPGEGMGGVRVEADGSSFYAVTSAEGSYALPVAGDGTYQLKFQRAGYAAVARSINVTGGLNVKVDYRGESVRVDNASRPTPTTVRLVVARSGAPGTLRLTSSPDMQVWTELVSRQSVLPDGRVQLDADIEAGASRRFLRVHADWSVP